MKNITAAEFAKILPNLDSESMVVDVREIKEYEESHIKDSINVPLSNIGQGLAVLKKYKTIYLICESGARSNYAREVLKTADIQTINISDGLNAIKKTGVVVIEEGQ